MKTHSHQLAAPGQPAICLLSSCWSYGPRSVLKATCHECLPCLGAIENMSSHGLGISALASLVMPMFCDIVILQDNCPSDFDALCAKALMTDSAGVQCSSKPVASSPGAANGPHDRTQFPGSGFNLASAALGTLSTGATTQFLPSSQVGMLQLVRVIHT